MSTQDFVSFSLAKKLNERGYNKYSPMQYVKNVTGEYDKVSLSFEECAYIEVTSNINIIYVPTLDEAYNWLYDKDSTWNISVLWDNKLKGYYFIVQNIETGYEYVQPTVPGQKNNFKLYECGIEHVLNRLDVKN